MLVAKCCRLKHKPQPNALCLNPVSQLKWVNQVCTYQYERVFHLEISVAQVNLHKLSHTNLVSFHLYSMNKCILGKYTELTLPNQILLYIRDTCRSMT